MKHSPAIAHDVDTSSPSLAPGVTDVTAESSGSSTILTSATTPNKIWRANMLATIFKGRGSTDNGKHMVQSSRVMQNKSPKLTVLQGDSNESIRDTTMEEPSYLPTPPQSSDKRLSKSSGIESQPKQKSGFTHRLQKMNSLFRKNGKGKDKDMSIKPQSLDQTEATQVVTRILDEVEPKQETNTDSSVLSSQTSHSHSGVYPSSTGKTSMDSKVNPSSTVSEKEQKDAAERGKQPNVATVVTRRNHPQTQSSMDTSLSPIKETALDGTTATILTAEKAAAAKIYLETYFNTLLSPTPRARQVRRDKLEAEIRSHQGNENFTPEHQEKMRKDFFARQTAHLRETRVLKAKSIRGRVAEKGSPQPSPVEDDYEVLKILGKGSFGVVRLVKEKEKPNHDDTSLDPVIYQRKQVYAMKVIRKSDMLRTSQEGHLRAERDFLVASEGSEW